MRLPPREGKPHISFILFSDDDAESPIILWEQRVEGMFHHGLTADHTDESAITFLPESACTLEATVSSSNTTIVEPVPVGTVRDS